MPITAKIHRTPQDPASVPDKVALSLAGVTVHLTADDAWLLARALGAVAQDIERHPEPMTGRVPITVSLEE